MKRSLLGFSMLVSLAAGSAAFAQNRFNAPQPPAGVPQFHTAQAVRPVQPAGHYETRNVQQWVEGRYVQQWVSTYNFRSRHHGHSQQGYYRNVWVAGHYETVPQTVWVAQAEPCEAPGRPPMYRQGRR